MAILKSQRKKIDWPLLVLCLGVVLFGLLAILDASEAIALRDFGDRFYFFRLQASWAAIGFFSMIVLSRIDYHLVSKFSFPLLLVATLFLVAVLLPGIGVKALGARRWLGLGPIGFQPADLVKLSLVIYLSSILSKRKSLAMVLIILFLFGGLIMAQPDLGTTAIVFGIGLSLFFVAGGSLSHLFVLGGLASFFGLMMILTSTYRRFRLLTFLDPTIDPLGISYHSRQILLALGSGGFFGLGPGQSRQKLEYLPEVATDSIFAVVAEEMGFLGGAILILALFLIIARLWRVASNAPDETGRLLVVGVASWVAIQTIVNLGAMTALFPLTGVPLPFVSYGGSSLVLLLSGVGIALNVSEKKIKQK
ncbi:cell division protein FtsW [Candidatus Shapirobacteria bacterium]|nr:cell division protein FtsW [Candidatus Shapirobacteria bacterium]